MIYEYKIAKGISWNGVEENITELEEDVNALIRNGWELYGDAFNCGVIFCQPMIRRKPKENLLERGRVAELREKALEPEKNSSENPQKKSKIKKEWLIEK